MAKKSTRAKKTSKKSTGKMTCDCGTKTYAGTRRKCGQAVLATVCGQPLPAKKTTAAPGPGPESAEDEASREWLVKLAAAEAAEIQHRATTRRPEPRTKPEPNIQITDRLQAPRGPQVCIPDTEVDRLTSAGWERVTDRLRARFPDIRPLDPSLGFGWQLPGPGSNDIRRYSLGIRRGRPGPGPGPEDRGVSDIIGSVKCYYPNGPEDLPSEFYDALRIALHEEGVSATSAIDALRAVDPDTLSTSIRAAVWPGGPPARKTTSRRR